MSSILRSNKTRFTREWLFYTQGPLFWTLVREEAIFAVCKRCVNEGFACMCKGNVFFLISFDKFDVWSDEREREREREKSLLHLVMRKVSPELAVYLFSEHYELGQAISCRCECKGSRAGPRDWCTESYVDLKAFIFFLVPSTCTALHLSWRKRSVLEGD